MKRERREEEGMMEEREIERWGEMGRAKR